MAPTIIGTNCLTMAEDAVVELVANLSAWQAWIGAPGDVAAAKSRVFVHDLPQTLEADSDTWSDAEYISMYPMCLVREPQDGGMFRIVQSARDQEIRFDPNLMYSVTFEQFAHPNMDDQDAIREFMQSFGAVIDEMVAVANAQPGQFAFTLMQQSGSLYRRHFAKHESLGDVIGCSIELQRTIE